MAVGGGVGKLLISIGLKSTVKADGKRVEKETGAIAKGIEKKGLMIGAGMTAVGVGAKLMADNINKSYLTFDSAMAEVKSLGGVTAEQMEIMRSSAIGISKELPLSAQNVAGGFYMMRSAGFDAARVIEELPAIAEMAVAGNLEMADAVNATTMVLDTYGERAGSAADITNVLMGTVQAFKTTLPELQTQLSKNIGVAASLNISFGELAAMSGMLKKEFVSAEEAGTAMKTMLLRLVDPTVLEKLENMGVKVEDANGDFIGMQSILDGLATKLDETGGEVEQMAMLQELFGTEGLRAAMSLIRQKDELKGYTDAVNSGTSVQEALNAVLESTQSQLDIANNKMEAAKITMGEAMAPATILTAEALAGFAGVLEDIPSPLQTVIGGGMQFSKVFIGIGPLLMGISAIYPMYAAAQLTAAAAGMTLTASIWASTIALLANPIFWIPAVIMVVAGALYVLEKKFGVVTKSVDFMSVHIKKLVGWFKTKLEPVINIVRKVVARFGDKLLFLLGPIGLVIWSIKKLVGWFRKTGDEVEETEKAIEDLEEKMVELDEKTEETGKDMDEVAKMLHNLTTALSETEDKAADAGMSMEEFTDTMKETYPEIAEYENLLDAAEKATEDLAIAQEKIGESKEEVNQLTEAYNDLKNVMAILADEDEDREDLGFRIKDTIYAQEDAQERYTKAVEDFGAGSKEAERAQHNLTKAIDRREDAEEELVDFNKVIEDTDDKKTRILMENDAKDLKSLEDKLAAKIIEYDDWVIAETNSRQALADAKGLIEEAEATKGIMEWDRMKDYMEDNPVKRTVTTTYITKHSGGGEVLGSKQQGGAIPKTGLYLLHKDEHVVPASASAPSAASAIPTVHQEFTIYNYSDIQMLEKMIGESTNRGIHNKYSMR